ncbi:MAG: hypothetical protein ACFFCE_17145 [Promethearchaeota archaeon]
MSLKCPVCGKEYYYDRKICQVCEERSIYSGLVCTNENKPQKWNCDIFLECNTLAFGRYKPNNAYVKIASEPKFSDFNTKNAYNWNCDSINEFESVKAPLIAIPTISKRDANNSLVYE